MAYGVAMTTENSSSKTLDEGGASMVEYALLVVLIALLALVAVTLAGEELSSTYSDIASSMNAAN